MSGPILLTLRLLLALILYGFLGWAFYTVWQDLIRNSQSISQRRSHPITLVLQTEGAETSPHRFNSSEVILGRDPASHISVNDETVSARHTRLSYRQGQWWVQDLRSTNGTYLNKQLVEDPMVVASGDQLRCGQVNFKIIIGGDEHTQ
jgi:pSer/pThr/pTyr-binding forkhead associated (FHA) protein